MYVVRSAELKDMGFIMGLAEREGRNPGLSDGDCFFHADPGGFFIGERAGERVGCISAIRYGAFGFIGLYIVKEEYRHKGYGLALWERAMERLEGCNVGLDGVVKQQENYKRYGFRLAHRNLRFSGSVTKAPPDAPCVVSAQSLPFSEVAAYDAKHFPAPRRAFLMRWLSMRNAGTLCFYRNGMLRGYGTIRQCVAGYKIGPLFADADDIAETLFLSLAGFAKGAVVSLDIAEPNESARALCERFGMARQFETARMYTRFAPPLDRGAYGITSFELG
ncbi:MAG: GNAT family N-acetyltransferase [Clostridiaceae bacterium]|nr:GNAT family N-acetyltransferase [Eubacteriales bacterium]